MAEGNRNRTKTISLGMMTIEINKKNGHFSAITVEIIDYCSSRHFNTAKNTEGRTTTTKKNSSKYSSQQE